MPLVFRRAPEVAWDGPLVILPLLRFILRQRRVIICKSARRYLEPEEAAENARNEGRKRGQSIPQVLKWLRENLGGKGFGRK